MVIATPVTTDRDVERLCRLVEHYSVLHVLLFVHEKLLVNGALVLESSCSRLIKRVSILILSP